MCENTGGLPVTNYYVQEDSGDGTDYGSPIDNSLSTTKTKAISNVDGKAFRMRVAARNLLGVG